jgi:hypothetical protein
MSQSIFSKLADEILPPIVGTVSVLNANTTGQTQDLSLCGNLSLDMRNADALPVAGGASFSGSATPVTTGSNFGGQIGRFCEVFADGGDIGVLFGANAAVLGGSNVVSLSAAGVNAAGAALRIPSGTYRTFVIHPAARFLGYIAASGTANVRICATSRTG